MKNLKICHIDGLKQGNTPICGIYAFINGFYDGGNTEEWMALIDYLWNLSIDGNLHNHSRNNAYNITAHDLTYSTIGEFFSSDNLYSFLNNKKCILPKLQKIDSGIDTYEVNKISDINFKDAEFKVDTFYIIPINSSDFFESNMHWICVKRYMDEVIIVNSAKNYNGEINADIKSLRGLTKIKYLFQLNAVGGNMKKRKSKTFNFIKWWKKYGSKIDRNIPNLKSNAQIISSASKFNYSFCYSNFDIIQIDITRK